MDVHFSLWNIVHCIQIDYVALNSLSLFVHMCSIYASPPLAFLSGNSILFYRIVSNHILLDQKWDQTKCLDCLFSTSFWPCRDIKKKSTTANMRAEYLYSTWSQWSYSRAIFMVCLYDSYLCSTNTVVGSLTVRILRGIVGDCFRCCFSQMLFLGDQTVDGTLHRIVVCIANESVCVCVCVSLYISCSMVNRHDEMEITP